MKRYDLSDGGIRGNFDLVMSKHSGGKWVKFEDVKMLVIKLTQDRTWNDPSIQPIEREDCFVMLLDGEIKPAQMIDGEWVKLVGYPYDFEFDKSDVIKWRYDLRHKN